MPGRNGLPDGDAVPRESKSPRFLRLAAIGGLVAVAALAIGSASRPHAADVSLSAPEIGGLSVLLLLVVAGGIGLLVGRNFIGAWARGAAIEDPNQKKTRVPAVVRVLLPIFVLAIVVMIRMWANGRDATPFTPNLPNTSPIDPSSAPTDGGDLGLMIACVVVAVVAALVARAFFRKRIAPALPPVAAEGAATILDEGLGALLGESDPRRAVIAAYVAMERAMARQGWARRPAEAPTEYLTRVLRIAPARAGDLDRLVGPLPGRPVQRASRHSGDARSGGRVGPAPPRGSAGMSAMPSFQHRSAGRPTPDTGR